MIQPFHVAVPVHNLDMARSFYSDVLGCQEGRSSEQWIDFNFYGHQFVVHHKEGMDISDRFSNDVDHHAVPIPHYGVVLTWTQWEELAAKLKNRGIDFIIEPYVRFKGKVGEQATMFFSDPSGNALEFKAFKDISQLFAK